MFFREQGGDENWQAHRVDIETGDIRALTPGPGVQSYVQQVSARFPGELLISHNERDKRYFDVYRVNVATGEARWCTQNDSFAEMFTDPQFRVRCGMRCRADGGGCRQRGRRWERARCSAASRRTRCLRPPR